jgi:2-methylcitrate dehydratase PrpD
VSAEHGRVSTFVHATGRSDLPAEVLHQARRCLLDLLGVAAAGTGTAMSRILREHAHRQSGGPAATSRLLFDGRRAGAAPAALANAGTIDAMDGHDGHRLVKGHAGAAVLPAALALLEPARGRSLEDLLVALVVGYEVALRAGMTLHRTAADYHSSGAWNALGAAAVGARLLELDAEQTCHALGTAEYSAPRGPMMRAVEHPTMVKDSSAWGAQAGVAAALLAAEGFTGAPAELVDNTLESHDLGLRWRITELYFKPHPVCRWAHPAIQAGLSLAAEHAISPEQVRDVEVITFDAAARLRTVAPGTTEEAQYSLPFAVASALVHGEIVPENLLDPASETRVLRLAQKVRTTSSETMTDAFPAVRRAAVRITLADGRRCATGPVEADGDPDAPLTDDALLEKFRRGTRTLDPGRSAAIAELVLSGQDHDLGELLPLVSGPL